jgi:hypothetical protein
MRELRVNEDANEITIISRFDLVFQLLRDYFRDISEFYILCRIVAVNKIVETSKGKITCTLDLLSLRLNQNSYANRAPQSATGLLLFDNLHLTAAVIIIFLIHDRPVLEKDNVILPVSGRNCRP